MHTARARIQLYVRALGSQHPGQARESRETIQTVQYNRVTQGKIAITRAVPHKHKRKCLWLLIHKIQCTSVECSLTLHLFHKHPLQLHMYCSCRAPYKLSLYYAPTDKLLHCSHDRHRCIAHTHACTRKCTLSNFICAWGIASGREDLVHPWCGPRCCHHARRQHWCPRPSTGVY